MARQSGVSGSPVVRCLYCRGKDLERVTERVDGMPVLACSDCGLMMVAELPSDPASLYTEDYFEKNQAASMGYMDYFSSPAANVIGKYAFARLLVDKPDRHLDLGAADGSLMEVFRDQGIDTTGLEISEHAVKIAKAKGLIVTESDLSKFPSKTVGSDLITAFDVLEHVADPRKVLEQANNALTNGGCFVFSTLAVTKRDATEYWFNNSLEHLVYFTSQSLERILTDVFGKKTFAFMELNINGVTEFWGVARKNTSLTKEIKLFEMIDKDGFDSGNAEGAYLLALFYLQVARHAAAAKVAKYFATQWSALQAVRVAFYSEFYKGNFQEAVNLVEQDRRSSAVRSAVFWQAYEYARRQYEQADRRVIAEEHAAQMARQQTQNETLSDEIVSLRGQVFKLRDELHVLRNSRMVGKIIKARNVMGAALPKVPHAPRWALRKAHAVVSPFIPEAMKPTLRKGRDKLKRALHRRLQSQMTYRTVNTAAWDRQYPLVSVIIPYYNRADTIDETLDSLARQTFCDFETIIVDDGSTNPESVVKFNSLAEHQTSPKLIRQINQGVAAARNNGIQHSRGKYIVCLDSDDMIAPTYLEKAVVLLETSPDVSLVTSHQDMFGVINEMFCKNPYNPLQLYRDNMVITAAAFRRELWEATGGYKSNIGYEDWEFWLCAAEHGHWGKLVPEALFYYRTSLQSRYVEDKDVHWDNIKTIRNLHRSYIKKVKALLAERRHIQHLVDPVDAFRNLSHSEQFHMPDNNKPNVLIVIPWMTFGGAESLLYAYGLEIRDRFNLSFITGLRSENEWEYKFRELTDRIYHMPNLFDDDRLYLEFISHYITTRHIDVMHIVHNGFMFELLPELRKRHPSLKILVTMFNDRVEFFEESLRYAEYIDAYSSDNQRVVDHFQRNLPSKKAVVIPNGIDCFDRFNPDLFDRAEQRRALGVADDELVILFIGRLSEEKNPDVFVAAAKKLLASDKASGVRFFMIGDGSMRPQIEQAIHALDNKTAVTYLGYQTDVPKYLSAADVYVLPSAFEGFPTSMLEAMAMNVLVIASDVGAVSTVIESGRNGFVVTPGSAEEIADAIYRLRHDPKLFAACKRDLRNIILAKYSTKVLGDNYTGFYNEP
jgi:glycosyltransferase involved in cell wall biosynthesis/SAM-dependent methyltransferase